MKYSRLEVLHEKIFMLLENSNLPIADKISVISDIKNELLKKQNEKIHRSSENIINKKILDNFFNSF